MNQQIPGSIEVAGREFFYVETRDSERFRIAIDEALAGSPDLPLPKSGGGIEERAKMPY